jgi:hypothetical protein
MLRDLPADARELVQSYCDRRELFSRPGFLDARGFEPKEGQSKRAALAEWMVGPQNPWFGAAFANRVFGQLLGRGLTEPIDDLTGSEDRIVPELLSEVAAAFQGAGTDVRYLYRALLATRAYARGAAREVAEEPPAREALERWLAAHPVRSLSAEQLSASLLRASGIEEGGGALREHRLERRRSQLLAAMIAHTGMHDGTRGVVASIPQSLFMMNGEHLVRGERSTLGGALPSLLDGSLPIAERLRPLFVATLNRTPRGEEIEALAVAGADWSRADEGLLDDLYFALTNSTEFQTNH